jgi:hypothetical protein
MSTIPTSVTEEQINAHILPFLSTAKRGFVSKIPLYRMFNYVLYRLHTGCQWDELPIAKDADNPAATEISWWAVYYHYRK